MPRQALNRASPTVTQWSFGPDCGLLRPELMAIVGQCAALWSEVDLHMAMLLSVLLKAETDAAVAVFLTLRTARAQRDALNAAAAVRLDESGQEIFGAGLNIVRGIEKQRNDLVHGCVGISDEMPDALLWLDQKHYAHWLSETWAKGTNLTGREHSELAKKMFVYQRKDLEILCSDIRAAWDILFMLVIYVRWKPGDGGKSREQVYHQLCDLPQIQTELARMRSGQKSNP
jgi:hypothetical protein